MDPDHPSIIPLVPAHVTPPNQPILLRAVNQSPFLNSVYSLPQFQPRPQFMPPPLPQQQTPPSQLALVPTPELPTIIDPPYYIMICGAIRDLNEPNGSTKLAISTHMRRSHTHLPPNHESLLTYHLRTMRNSGVVTMVNNSYKLSDASPPPQRVAFAATDLVAPRSEFPPLNTSGLDLLAASASGAASASQPQKRGRGRPPKARPEPITVASHGQSSREQQPELPVTSPNQVDSESANRRPGRPRMDGSVPNAPTAGEVLVLPALIEATSQRGMKRGPGRPPKISRNRPRKSATPKSIRDVTGTQDSATGELKRKLDLACEKAKEIMEVLKAAGTGSDVFIAMSQARPGMEELIPILTVEPHGVGQGQPHAVEEMEARAVEQPEAMEEVQPEEAMDEVQI